jgi:phosphoglycerate dehydrogenase-like enzyme
MRVAFLDPLEARLGEFGQRYLGGHEVLSTAEAGRLPDGVEDAEAVVWWNYPVDAAFIQRLPSLRFMQRIGIFRTKGDTTAALSKGIPVSAIPHGVSDRVAQHAMALTLALAKQLLPSHNAVLAGLNPDNMPEQETGAPAIATNWTRTPDIETLSEKTVGILGFGEIGACFARYIAPYNCRVLYYKRTPLSPDLERYFGVEYASMEDILRNSDVVQSFLPYSEETRKILGARELGLMKPSALFVNVGRGNTVDEPALIDALSNRRIAAAGLDVFAVEPLPADSPLKKLDNVILTPHSAGGLNGWIHAFQRIAENLRRVEAGEAVMLPVTASDPQWG